jgi:hypothetical protein
MFRQEAIDNRKKNGTVEHYYFLEFRLVLQHFFLFFYFGISVLCPHR